MNAEAWRQEACHIEKMTCSTSGRGEINDTGDIYQIKSMPDVGQNKTHMTNVTSKGTIQILVKYIPLGSILLLCLTQ